MREPETGAARRRDVDDADADDRARSVALDAFPDAFDDARDDARATTARADATRARRGGAAGRERAAWALGLLTCAYCHASATGFLLPSLLPAMSADLKLDDGQGAVLTTLFTVTYSLLLPLVGVLADTVDRKNLLAAGGGDVDGGVVHDGALGEFYRAVDLSWVVRGRERGAEPGGV